MCRRMALSSTAYGARRGAEGGRRARGHRHADAGRLDRAEGRALRRSAAEEISRDHRSQEPGDRAAWRPRAPTIPITPNSAGSARRSTCRAGRQRVWKQQGRRALSPGHPVTLTWDNGQGLDLHPHDLGRRPIHVHRRRQRRPTNPARADALSLSPMWRARACRRRSITGCCMRALSASPTAARTTPNTTTSRTTGTPAKTFSSTGGWVGITDKYWMAAVIPPQSAAISTAPICGATTADDVKAYQADYRLRRAHDRAGRHSATSAIACSPAPRSSTYCAATNRRTASRNSTMPSTGAGSGSSPSRSSGCSIIFYKFIGNFGLAILLLTVVIKLLFFPLANASFKSMSKMKKLQPEMERIKQALRRRQIRTAAAGDDGAVQAREGQSGVGLPADADPDSGVLLALQGAVRHHRDAPGAVLSAGSTICPRPIRPRSSICSGFCPSHPPLLQFRPISRIGIWPILMGFTQWVQTKLNPAPADPVQAQDVRLHAADLHLHVRDVPGGAGDLLHLEQSALASRSNM